MSQNLDFSKLLTPAFKTEFLDNFLSNTVNKFVSEESSILVNGKIGNVKKSERFPAADYFDEVNSLAPVITVKLGKEELFFTFKDILSRMDILGIDTDNLHLWLREISSNYTLPINYDKFANYANYVWIGKSMLAKGLNNECSWNPIQTPEYYVIANYADTDLIKKPVKLATTKPINLYVNDRKTETFTLTFTSNNHFTLESSLGQIQFNNALSTTVPGFNSEIIVESIDTGSAPSLGRPNPINPLLKFFIKNGEFEFETGDVFTITVEHYTSNISTQFTSLTTIGKGSVYGVECTSPYMYIDGEEVKEGDRILVKDQLDPSQNGIYNITTKGEWVRALDAQTENQLRLNSEILVTSGTVNRNLVFKLSSKGTAGASNIFTLELSPSFSFNDWQLGNYWVHKNDPIIQQLKLDNDLLLQAKRPIIEYDADLELNQRVVYVEGSNDTQFYPSNAGRLVKQRKLYLNQKPLFNLYNYDSSHSKLVGSIFTYDEDPSSTFDNLLLIKPKYDDKNNYIFTANIKNSNGRYLFWKQSGQLKSIWQQRHDGQFMSTPSLAASTKKAVFSFTGIAQNIYNEEWTVVFKNSSSVIITGSYSGNIGSFDVTDKIVTDLFTINISNKVADFAGGDEIKFHSFNRYFPRFVIDLNEQIVNTDLSNKDGTWMVPRQMVKNLRNDFEKSISFPDLSNHLKDVIAHQDANAIIDKTLGGQIQIFSRSLSLLISMLIQPEVSVLGILDFAKSQYTQLNDIATLVANDSVLSMVENTPINSMPLGNISNGLNSAFLNIILDYFKNSEISKNIYYDTTSGLTNIVASLANLGLVQAVKPSISFDMELGIDVLIHHDGHRTPVVNNEFAVELVKQVRTRANGLKTPGIFSKDMPLIAHKKQLWYNINTETVYILDVQYEGVAQPAASTGEFWLDTGANVIKMKTTLGWDIVPAASRWKLFNYGVMMTNLFLALEKRLYDNIFNFTNRLEDFPINFSFLENELLKYASFNGLDTYASNYSTTDAFTWNYKSAFGKATWFDVYRQHFTLHGLPSLCRPNVEPWKLLGFTTQPSSWLTNYRVFFNSSLPLTDTVDYVFTDNIFPMAGLPSVTDFNLSTGNTVLLTGQNYPSSNGVYILSAGAWVRKSTPVQVNSQFRALNGNYKNSVWTIIASGSIDIDPITIVQNRPWSNSMWNDIKAANPSLKLCVNTFTDELLPPYVNSSLVESSEALLISAPASAQDDYIFGDNGPVELVWKKSLDFKYASLIAMFRTNPLAFIDIAWGEKYFTVGNNRKLEFLSLDLIQPQDFALHGEQTKIANVEIDISKHFSYKINSWTGTFDLKFIIRNIGLNKVSFEITVNDERYGFMSLNDHAISFAGDGFSVDISDIYFKTEGETFNINDVFLIKFTADKINYSVEEILDCEGCVHPDAEISRTVESVVVTPPVFEYVKNKRKILLGLGQVYTNMLRYNNMSTKSAALTFFRKWENKLGYAFNGLIRPDSLKLSTHLGPLPDISYETKLKKNLHISNIWFTGLRVQLTDRGFRIESYNSKKADIDVCTYSDDTRVTFTPLNKDANGIWTRRTNINGTTKLKLPLVVKGLQQTVDVLFSYIDYIQSKGMTYIDNRIDEETGKLLTWELEVEKLIDRIKNSPIQDSGHILNPFLLGFKIKHNFGLLSKFENNNAYDFSLSQQCYDILGVNIENSKLSISRCDEYSVVSSSTPIFSASLFMDSFEHLILFNDKFIVENAYYSLFNQFLGVQLTSADMSCLRNRTVNGKPTYDGFFNVGGNFKRNIASSVTSMGNYYDSTRVFLDKTTAEHSTALLGYTKKDYFDNFNLDESAKFNFWKNSIQMKGTNCAVAALSNLKQFSTMEMDEYWAVKLGEYGDARRKVYIDLKITVDDTIQKFAKFNFYNESLGEAPIQYFSNIESNDITRWATLDDTDKDIFFDSDTVSEEIDATSFDTFPQYVKLKNIYEFLQGVSPLSNSDKCVIVNMSTVKVSQKGIFKITGKKWKNVTKFAPLKLFDKNKHLVTDIGLWHPAAGAHYLPALGNIDIISNTDLAVYSNVNSRDSNPSFNELKSWGKKEVGRVFWDTSNLSYIPYYDAGIFDSLNARLIRWGALSEWASVDVSEWIESNVHPKDFEAANSSSGISAGKIAKKQYFYRNRIINRKPIAWSFVPTGINAAHPAFGPATFIPVYISGKSIIIDSGTGEEIGLTQNRSFSAWDKLYDKPLGEVKLTAVTGTILGSLYNPTVPGLTVSAVFNEFSSKNVKIIDTTAILGKTGKFTFAKISRGGSYFLRITDISGLYEDFLIEDWNAIDANDTIRNYTFSKFGILVSVTRTTSGNILASRIIDYIVNNLDVVARQYVEFEELLPLPSAVKLSNSDDDVTDFGWKCWTIPTQSDLDKDLLYPNNTWLPILGDDVQITANSALIEEIKSNKLSFTLKSGAKIQYFNTTWSAWNRIDNVLEEIVSDGSNFVSFTIQDTNIDVNRISVYINGSQLSTNSYRLVDNKIILNSVYSEGFIATLLYRHYQPSAAELAFDPSVEDDLSIQKQHIEDYSYSRVDTKDANSGTFTSKYYFWVTGSSLLIKNRSVSTELIKQGIISANGLYCILDNLRIKSSKYGFSSMLVTGLNRYVSSNTYQLRFLNDFTLRNDPEEMSLKNVHTEWALIRKNQKSKIFKKLWDLVTDAVCAQTVASKKIPSKNYIDFDKTYGTSTRFGFGVNQIFADTEQLQKTIKYIVLNSNNVSILGNTSVNNRITGLNYTNPDSWFIDAVSSRKTMQTIWSNATVTQVNEIFFECLNDALSCNKECGDIFKTSIITANAIFDANFLTTSTGYKDVN